MLTCNVRLWRADGFRVIRFWCYVRSVTPTLLEFRECPLLVGIYAFHPPSLSHMVLIPIGFIFAPDGVMRGVHGSWFSGLPRE